MSFQRLFILLSRSTRDPMMATYNDPYVTATFIQTRDFVSLETISYTIISHRFFFIYLFSFRRVFLDGQVRPLQRAQGAYK